ncbi:uncharacterized protein LOC118736152 [Rhagoletis pomonella]|uniref:uncharacterized protein LOC118736152 n=1 Tax=Rhagoletis pomonella TaxID=28610 RepID=UPI001781E302|nr:uncharacterized protein LOC118736152 [Rhagoletis pomonella]
MSVSTVEHIPTTSRIVTRRSLENLHKIDLVGRTSHQITGAKLPSNKQLLQVFFYNMRFVDLNAKDSAKLAINAAKIFWQQAKIPTREDHKCADKLIKLYENWKSIQKTAPNKRSNAQKRIAEEYVNNLEDLFDIATADALDTMKIWEGKQFLEMQRQKGRPGCMTGVDMVLYGREKRAQERLHKEQERKRKHHEQTSQESAVVNLMDWNDSDNENEIPFGEPDINESETSYYMEEVESMVFESNASSSAVKRGRKHFITSRLVAALDNA